MPVKSSGTTMSQPLSELDQAFLQAAEEGNIEKLRRLWQQGAHICAHKDGKTAAYILAQKNHGQAVLALAKLDVRALDPTIKGHMTAAHWLALYGNSRALMALVNISPAILEQADAVSRLTVAHWIAGKDDLETLLKMAKVNAAVLMQTDMAGHTPASRLSVESVVRLAKSYPHVKQQTSIIGAAILKGDPVYVKVLIKAGFALPDDVNTRLAQANLTRADIGVEP